MLQGARGIGLAPECDAVVERRQREVFHHLPDLSGFCARGELGCVTPTCVSSIAAIAPNRIAERFSLGSDQVAIP